MINAASDITQFNFRILLLFIHITFLKNEFKYLRIY